MLEFLLDASRRTAFGLLDELADRYVRRYLDEQVHVILRQGAADNVYAHLSADLPHDVPHPQAHVADQNLVTVLRSPDDVEPVMKQGVRAAAVRHIGYPRRSETSRPQAVSLLRGYPI